MGSRSLSDVLGIPSKHVRTPAPPPPPAPPAPPPPVETATRAETRVATQAGEQAAARRRRGRRSTVLTGPLGILEEPELGRATLLGRA